MKGLLSWIKQWGEARRFLAQPAAERQMVFYAEDRASMVHFRPILRHLTGTLNQSVSYLTSDPSDPVLQNPMPGLKPFCVGSGAPRTYLFTSLQAGLMVMTMPDLESFHIKRSQVAKVNYVYVFHSLVSSHVIYRPAAFRHYDTILCSGPHHVRELQAEEQRYKTPARRLVQHGYGRLDSILEQKTGVEADPRQVLVAPTWGASALLERYGLALTEVLLQAGFRTILRPHPVTVRKQSGLMEELRRRFSSHPDFVLETDVTGQESLHRSAVMISDWSGAAFEFAFGQERPVLFVDVPQKVNNPEHHELGIEAVEKTLRSQLGALVAPDRLVDVPDQVRRLAADPGAQAVRLRSLREETVFNVGRSGEVGAEALMELSRELGPTR